MANGKRHLTGLSPYREGAGIAAATGATPMANRCLADTTTSIRAVEQPAGNDRVRLGRRLVISLVPVAGLGLLGACSDRTQIPNPPAPTTGNGPAGGGITPGATSGSPGSTSAGPGAGGAGSGLPGATPPSVATPAALLPMVNPSDPQAQALGYVSQAAQADKAKFPRHAATQQCASCSLYGGPPSQPQASCALFPGRNVAAAAWCSAWVARA